MEKERAFREILHVIEDQTRNELDKWRNFCYCQLIKIKECQMMNTVKIDELNQVIMLKRRELESMNEKLKEKIIEKESMVQYNRELINEEESVNNAVIQAEHERGIDRSIGAILHQLPRTFSQRYQIYKAKMKNVMTMFVKISQFCIQFCSQVDSLVSKINAINVVIKKKKASIQNERALYARIIEEKGEVQEQINSIIIPDFPQSLMSIKQEYPNPKEATIQLQALQELIADLQERIKNNKVEIHESEIPVLEELIRKENSNYEEVMLTIQEQYDIESLDLEINSRTSNIEILQKTYESLKEESEEKISTIEIERKQAYKELKSQIDENQQIISQLNEEEQALIKMLEKQELTEKPFRSKR